MLTPYIVDHRIVLDNQLAAQVGMSLVDLVSAINRLPVRRDRRSITPADVGESIVVATAEFGITA